MSTAFFSFVNLGGTVAGTLTWRAAVPVAIWMVPFSVYLLGVRTRVVSITGGIILFVGSLWALIALFRESGSTAGVGLLFRPFLLTVGAVLVVIVDLHLR